MKNYVVYKWTNAITGKSYIGFTGDGILFRWNKHLLNARSGGDTYFYRSIRKYGSEVWSCIKLFETNNIDDAKSAEIEMIKANNTLSPNGYNSTRGGTGGNTWHGAKLEQRKREFSIRHSGSGNMNANPITDAEIIQHAANCYLQNNNWISAKWKIVQREHKIPLHFVKSRFADFGGGSIGFKVAVQQYIKKEHHINVTLKYVRTKSHNEKLAAKLKGKVWVTNLKTNYSYPADKNEIDNVVIVKGRNRKC